MESLRQLFKIGYGPSSSHTMGPRRAALAFVDIAAGRAASFEVTLYGSLAATGRGHLTDRAILDVLTPVAPAEIVWKPDVFLPFHPNGMTFKALDADGNVLEQRTWFSVGGGDIVLDGEERSAGVKVYDMTTIESILQWCARTGKSYWEYVDECEGPAIWDYLHEVWTVMKEAVLRGIEAEGVLPGGLGVRRKAVSYYVHAAGYAQSLKSRGLVYAYALAVSEENAAGGKIVTAPTCGSCGVMPAVLYHLHTSKGFSEQRILRALATAGLFGNVVKTNASVSGAEVGCQGEVGVACAMAAAAASQLFGGTPAQIEYSAEMGLEHHLGLTCDPVCGLVQIPCIERNAYAAARALDSNLYAAFSDGQHSVKFDRIVEVMKQTGHDLPSIYKETSQGGLAAIQ
ncbi:MAG: L-serine ammonia-lyase [Muribaculaceae bacterium]